MRDRGQIMTEAERQEILEWVCANFFSMIVISPSLLDGQKPGRVRKQLSPLDPDVPAAIWRIKKRIVEREGLEPYMTEPIMKDLISVMLPGGKIFPHRDLNIGEYIHSRFNVFIQLSHDECRTFYGGERIEAVEGHYTLCRSGTDMHWSDIHRSPVPRINLSFGFLIPREVLNRKYEFPLIKTPVGERPMPDPLTVEHARLWAAQGFGSAWWWSGEFGNKINGAA